MKHKTLIWFMTLAACGQSGRGSGGDGARGPGGTGGAGGTGGSTADPGAVPADNVAGPVDPFGTEFGTPGGGFEDGNGASVITQPAASDLEVIGHGPEARALIEHYPQENAVAFQMRIRRGFCPGNVDDPDTCRGGANHGDSCDAQTDCASAPLTFDSGVTEYFDADGNSLGIQLFDANDFDLATDLDDVGICFGDPSITCTSPGSLDSASCGGTGDDTCLTRVPGYVPDHTNILIRNPAELVDHNLVPAQAEMRICFAEFDTMAGCDPLVIRQDVEEYRVPPGPTYIYPLGNPDEMGGVISSNFGHEPANHHRGVNNQRHAYDVGVLAGGVSKVDTNCVMDACVGGAKEGDACASKTDCLDNANSYVYGEPIVAMAGGVIVAILHDYPDNPIPGEKLPAVNGCDVRACSNPVDCDDPMTKIPTTGNSVFIEYGTGEISHYAHTIPGTNNHLDCGESVLRGDVVGNVGNSGNSGGPHLHYGNLKLAEFWDGDNYSLPSYYTNVQFAAGPDPTLRRQLDIGLRNATKFTILSAPTPLAANAAVGPGAVAESEANDTLGGHDSLAYPVEVAATLEMANVGDLAVRGDGIEDVYRIDLSGADALRIAIGWTDGAKNLDVYALTEDLRVINETGQGTRRAGTVEELCAELDAGAYYLMVTNFDPTKSGDEPYELSVESDPQTISAAITNAVQPIEVDASCEATVEFKITIHDNCCLDPETLDLQVGKANPTGNATLGPTEVDALNVIGPRDIEVTGRFAVSDLTSCPAEVVVFAQADDCSGNQVSTGDQGTDAFTAVVDLIPPEVVASDEDLYCLWPPEHLYACFAHDDFAPVVLDNCAQPPAWLFDACTSDQPEDAPDDGDPNGDGNTVDDCVIGAGSDDVCARAERAGQDPAGRRYTLDAVATDQCGNASPATPIGNIYVPRDQNPALVCIDPPGP